MLAAPTSRAREICRACSGASQFRLMLCHDCWRLLPPIVLREWNWARTSSAKLVVAELVAIWADAYREALAERTLLAPSPPGS